MSPECEFNFVFFFFSPRTFSSTEFMEVRDETQDAGANMVSLETFRGNALRLINLNSIHVIDTMNWSYLKLKNVMLTISTWDPLAISQKISIQSWSLCPKQTHAPGKLFSGDDRWRWLNFPSISSIEYFIIKQQARTPQLDFIYSSVFRVDFLSFNCEREQQTVESIAAKRMKERE